MKLRSTKSAGKAGVAMTEYLILLALVAIASLALIMPFGKEVKTVFASAVTALRGQKSEENKGTVVTAKDSTMADFAVEAGK